MSMNAPPKPPPTEYAFSLNPERPKVRASAFEIWQMLAVILISGSLGVMIGLRMVAS